MDFEVTILGNNSAFPAHGRFPTSQVVRYNNSLFMVDCGEGSQIRLSQNKIKRSKIDHIFISHLHGDHVYGLPGLLNSYAHFGRKRPMYIYGPKGIRQLIDTILRLTSSMVDFEIIFHELEGKDKRKVLEAGGLRVYAFPLVHRIPTYGYRFDEKEPQVNMRKDAIEKYHLSVNEILAIKSGRVYAPEGVEIPREELVTEKLPRSYAYCSDTVFDKDIVPCIADVDLLYHEATFLHELEDTAAMSKHTTSFQAGMIAHMANAGRLIIGHFSSRYDDVTPLLEEAREVFVRTDIAEEGMSFQV